MFLDDHIWFCSFVKEIRDRTLQQLINKWAFFFDKSIHSDIVQMHTGHIDIHMYAYRM
jgi:hypothetical protein